MQIFFQENDVVGASPAEMGVDNGDKGTRNEGDKVIGDGRVLNTNVVPSGRILGVNEGDGLTPVQEKLQSMQGLAGEVYSLYDDDNDEGRFPNADKDALARGRVPDDVAKAEGTAAASILSQRFATPEINRVPKDQAKREGQQAASKLNQRFNAPEVSRVSPDQALREGDNAAISYLGERFTNSKLGAETSAGPMPKEQETVDAETAARVGAHTEGFNVDVAADLLRETTDSDLSESLKPKRLANEAARVLQNQEFKGGQPVIEIDNPGFHDAMSRVESVVSGETNSSDIVREMLTEVSDTHKFFEQIGAEKLLNNSTYAEYVRDIGEEVFSSGDNSADIENIAAENDVFSRIVTKTNGLVENGAYDELMEYKDDPEPDMIKKVGDWTARIGRFAGSLETVAKAIEEDSIKLNDGVDKDDAARQLRDHINKMYVPYLANRQLISDAKEYSMKIAMDEYDNFQNQQKAKEAEQKRWTSAE